MIVYMLAEKVFQNELFDLCNNTIIYNIHLNYVILYIV